MRTASKYVEHQTTMWLPWLVLIGAFAASLASVVATREWIMLAMLLPVMALAFGIVWLMSRLTVTVTGSVLEWHFRGGFLRKQIPLREIAAVAAGRNPWWYGWGIRRTPRGWLYNVRGFGSVEVATRAGRHVLLGSDQPEKLAAAIRARLEN